MLMQDLGELSGLLYVVMKLCKSHSLGLASVCSVLDTAGVDLCKGILRAHLFAK